MGRLPEKPSGNGRRQQNLTRKQLRKYSFSLARLYLPKELEDYLLEAYNEEDIECVDGCMYNYSEEDVWFGVKKSVMEYAQIKKQMDDLLGASEYLGSRPLTIRVQNKPEFLRRLEKAKPQAAAEDCCSFAL